MRCSLSPLTTVSAQEALKGPAPFEALKFRSIGPAAGGRVSRAAGVPGNPLVYYAATASGGVWKSVDGGKTWTQVWRQEGQIGTMVVHPKNPDIAYAAVLGHAFGPNPERGVYRTKDGGKTWQQVLRKDPDTGASDVELDPSNPNIVFAGLWQARRRPWEMPSGGPGSGLYIVARWGRHLEAAHREWIARRHLGEGRRAGGTLGWTASLCDHRGRAGRALPVRRRR